MALASMETMQRTFSKQARILLGVEKSLLFTEVLKIFDLVNKACFSQSLHPCWKEKIDQFITSIWELVSFCKFTLGVKVTITWKVHILVAHVKDYLEMTGEGLANLSEQTGESSHHKVKQEMGRFKRDRENPRHGEKLLAGCKRFNSKRV